MNNESNDFDDDFEHAVDAYEREDYKTAYKLFLPLAEQEDSNAQCYLGLIYAKGHGVPQDFKESVKWLRLAAEQGIADAQNNLGAMYAFGRGVPQDYLLAHMWLNIAASNGQKIAIEKRIILQKIMTPEQIEKAKEMARNWKPTKK